MGTAHRLVRAGETAALAALLKADRRAASEIDEDGYPPLYYALKSTDPNPRMVEVLLESGADIGFKKVVRIGSLLSEFPRMGKDFLKSLGFQVPEELVFGEHEHREELLHLALTQGDLETIKLLVAHGADFTYLDPNGYTAILHACYSGGDRLALVQYLIGLGLAVDLPSSYGETPVNVASGAGRFDVVAVLLAAGANGDRLEWTPLIQAVAIGSTSDVARELATDPDLTPRDSWGRTALDVAVLKGDLGLARLLRSCGAAFSKAGDQTNSTLCLAVQGGDVAIVQWLVEQGCPVDSKNFLGETALHVATTQGSVEIMRALLDLGADPTATGRYGSIFDELEDKEAILLLLEHGAEPAQLRPESRRALLGLGAGGVDCLDAVTREQYLAARYPREGKANPEDTTEPFKVAMVRAGITAYGARNRFNDPVQHACRAGGSRGTPVWCAHRFGQSLTRLPDGRTVLVGGEHEDSYDPDFCIYNDVFVFSPDGTLRIFGYPETVFPPTDFHTATLVGDWIYLIGGLGYWGERGDTAPVRRLSTSDFHIETVRATGKPPGWLYRHQAALDGGGIRVWGGTLIRRRFGKEDSVDNPSAFRLDLETGVWLETKE